MSKWKNFISGGEKQPAKPAMSDPAEKRRSTFIEVNDGMDGKISFGSDSKAAEHVSKLLREIDRDAQKLAEENRITVVYANPPLERGSAVHWSLEYAERHMGHDRPDCDKVAAYLRKYLDLGIVRPRYENGVIPDEIGGRIESIKMKVQQAINITDALHERGERRAKPDGVA